MISPPSRHSLLPQYNTLTMLMHVLATDWRTSHITICKLTRTLLARGQGDAPVPLARIHELCDAELANMLVKSTLLHYYKKVLTFTLKSSEGWLWEATRVSQWKYSVLGKMVTCVMTLWNTIATDWISAYQWDNLHNFHGSRRFRLLLGSCFNLNPAQFLNHTTENLGTTIQRSTD
jgi:hypothetical protein